MRCQNIDIILNVLNAVKSVRLKVMMKYKEIQHMKLPAVVEL
jgi:hypothetical protein